MLVITFANGGCMTNGLTFTFTFIEWTRHGFMILVEGTPQINATFLNVVGGYVSGN
jgi:hypothetical protein